MNCLLLTSCLFYGALGIRWNKADDNQLMQQTRFVLEYHYKRINIDVAFEQQVVIVRGQKTFNKDIIISCYISEWQNASVINFFFCKDADCEKVPDGIRLQKIQKFGLSGKYETNFPKRKGLVVTLTLNNNNEPEDISGNYQCKAEDKQTSSIQSNYIQMRDTFYWRRHLFMETSVGENMTVTEISSQNVPIILSCKNDGTQLNNQQPEWTKEEFNSPVKWSACPVMSYANKAVDQMTKSKCKTYTTHKCDGSINPAICPQPMSMFSTEWKTYQTTDGDLIIFSVPKAQPLYTVMFMCYTYEFYEVRPIMFYYTQQSPDYLHITAGIEIKAQSTGVNVPLTIMSPTTQNVNAYARKVTDDEEMTEVYIYALYKGWPVTVGPWRKDGIEILKNDYVSFDKNAIVFSKEIRLDMAGNYTLDVTQNKQTVKMTINLNVLSPPAANPDDCPILPMYYVDAGKPVTILCTYTGSDLLATLTVKDQQLNFNMNQSELKKVLMDRHPEFSDASIMATSASVKHRKLRLNYTASSLTGHGGLHDHSMTFIVKNKLGMSVKQTNIYVVPQLKNVVRRAPELSDCTSNCRSQDIHYFHCEIDVAQYSNKNLLVDRYWTLQNRRIGHSSNKYSKYFHVDPQTNTLTLQSVWNVTDTDLKRKLESNEFVCRVDIRRLDNGKLYYTSWNDLSLGNMMRAKITLDFEDPNKRLENTQKVLVQRLSNLETKVEKMMETMVQQHAALKGELKMCLENATMLRKVVDRKAEELAKTKKEIGELLSKSENDKSEWRKADGDLRQLLQELRQMMNASRRMQEDAVGRLDNLDNAMYVVGLNWFVWRIKGISGKVGGSYDFSRTFYSDGTAGYKLLLCYRMDSSDGLYLAFRLMRGNDDDKLQWPMSRTVSIEIIDEQSGLPVMSQRVSRASVAERRIHEDMKKSYDRPTMDMNHLGDGFLWFPSYEKIKSTAGTIRNDAMTVRCRVLPQ